MCRFGPRIGSRSHQRIPIDSGCQNRVSTDASPWARSSEARPLLRIDMTPHLTDGSRRLLLAWVTYSTDAPKVVTRCRNAKCRCGWMRCNVCNACQCKCNANVSAKVNTAKNADAAQDDDDVGLVCSARKESAKMMQKKNAKRETRCNAKTWQLIQICATRRERKVQLVPVQGAS